MDDLNVFIPRKLNNINGFQGAGKIDIPHLKKSVSIDPKGQIYQKKWKRKRVRKKLQSEGKKEIFPVSNQVFLCCQKSNFNHFFSTS